MLDNQARTFYYITGVSENGAPTIDEIRKQVNIQREVAFFGI